MTGKRREVDYGRRDTEPSKWCYRKWWVSKLCDDKLCMNK